MLKERLYIFIHQFNVAGPLFFLKIRYSFEQKPKSGTIAGMTNIVRYYRSLFFGGA